jgi:hypothetical protein
MTHVVPSPADLAPAELALGHMPVALGAVGDAASPASDPLSVKRIA